MPAKDPSRSWLCVLRQPTEEQSATLLAKAGDRTLVFKAGLLELEGGGVQAWFAARDPNKLAVMKVPASWMQRNILNVGWHRSEMERRDDPFIHRCTALPWCSPWLQVGEIVEEALLQGCQASKSSWSCHAPSKHTAS